jgi:hypothetical protein
VKQIPEQTASEVNKRYRLTATVLFVQIFVTLALLALSFFLAGSWQPFGAPTGESFSVENLTNPQAGSSTLTTFLWVTILALALAAFLLRRVIFSSDSLRDAATLGGATGLLKNLQSKTILLASLGEVIAVLGFVIALASGSAFDMVRAAAVALIVFFINFPRKSTWERLAKTASQ